MGWFRILSWSVRHCLARPSAWQLAKVLELMQLLSFGRLALSMICLLIEGNSKSSSLFVSWKGSIWGKISCSLTVNLLESFRMYLAGERVSNHCLLDRMMFASTALSTSETWPSWAVVVSASCYVGNVKAKRIKAFSLFNLLVVFWKNKRFTKCKSC